MLVLALAGAAHAGPVHARGLVGLGFPELFHAEVGWQAAPRLSIEVHYGWIIFNHMVGPSVTGWLLGEARPDLPPRHALLVTGQVLVNPLAIGDGVASHADVLASAIGTPLGYGYTADSGFQFIVRAGPFYYLDNGFAVGANLHLGVGWTF
ncbi:MAG: hypothetical protein Q8P18_06880 [Pseudomonadota bacterium]|nr:hypothetical protein [Pseudomonadota bacterium]